MRSLLIALVALSLTAPSVAVPRIAPVVRTDDALRPPGVPSTAYPGSAFTSFDNSTFETGNPAVDHAPVFVFSRTGFTYDPCYPESALVDADTPNPGTCALNFGCPGGNPGESCRDPRADGVYNGSWTMGDPFPVYVTVCYFGDAPANQGGPQYRLNFDVYYVHDGVLSAGHRHDWESVTVIFGKVPGFEQDDWWMPTAAIYNQHSGHYYYKWNQLETVNVDVANGETDVSDRRTGLNRKHPKNYVGFFSHAAHAHRCTPDDTIWCVLVNTGAPNGDREFRGDDWWYLPRATDLHHGREVKDEWDYGHATSKPLTNQRDMCTGSWSLSQGPGQLGEGPGYIAANGA